jgi:hypothetical protein
MTRVRGPGIQTGPSFVEVVANLVSIPLDVTRDRADGNRTPINEIAWLGLLAPAHHAVRLEPTGRER